MEEGTVITFVLSDDNREKLEKIGFEIEDSTDMNSVLNHLIEETLLFEYLSGDSVTEYAKLNYKDAYNKWLNK